MKGNWMVLTAAAVAALSIFLSNATHILTLQKAFPLNTSQDLEIVIHRDHSRHQQLVGEFHLSGDVEISRLYYTKIALGSPPQEFNVYVDTGSDLLWVSCSTCNNCPRTTSLDIKLNFFNSSRSSTALVRSCSDTNGCSECIPETNTCGYKLSYLDGSATSGEIVTDLLQIHPIGGASPNLSSPVIFGCSTNLAGLFTQTLAPVDGVIGFGTGTSSILTQLYSAGISPNVFSHCLDGGETGGGFLVMGAVVDPNIVYSPIIPNQEHYNLELLSIAVGETLLPITSKALATNTSEGIIVDSGTSLAYLAEDVYEAFMDAVNSHVWKQVKKYLNYGCYRLVDAATGVKGVFPPVTLTFSGNATMALGPEDYLFRVVFSDGSADWCVGFQKSERGSYSILGDIVLRNKIVIYDLVKQQVGWSSQYFNCSSAINVDTTYGFKSDGTLSTSPRFKFLLIILIIIIWFNVLEC